MSELASRSSLINVTVFVDWNSQLLIYNISKIKDPLLLSRQAFNSVTRKISTCLAKSFPDLKFRVGLRIYHGWHKGYEPTANKKAITQIIAGTDFATLSHNPSVVFMEEVGYGDNLIGASTERLHKKLQIHLPNTVRDRQAGKGLEEKMVDTALASDVIVMAYKEPTDWIMVISEDDDFVPPLFVADSILNKNSSRALLLSTRRRSRNLINLENILMENQ